MRVPPSIVMPRRVGRDPVAAGRDRLEEADAQDAVVGRVDLDEVDAVQVDDAAARARSEVGAPLVDGARGMSTIAGHRVRSENRSTRRSPLDAAR